MQSLFSPKIVEALNELGFFSPQDIAKAKIEKVFLLLKAKGLTVTNSILWRLDAFSRNISIEDIDEKRKQELIQNIKQHPPVAIFPPLERMEFFMQEAINQAKIAQTKSEVPVGAVVVHKEQIIATAHNTCETDNMITQHAELKALEQAAKTIGSYRLDECDLYVTLEPCPMCAGAIIQSRIRRLIFATKSNKTGAAGGVLDLFSNRVLNQHTAVLSGIFENETTCLLKDFFLLKR